MAARLYGRGAPPLPVVDLHARADRPGRQRNARAQSRRPTVTETVVETQTAVVDGTAVTIVQTRTNTITQTGTTPIQTAPAGQPTNIQTVYIQQVTLPPPGVSSIVLPMSSSLGIFSGLTMPVANLTGPTSTVSIGSSTSVISVGQLAPTTLAPVSTGLTPLGAAVPATSVSDGELSTGAIVGIALGSVASLVALAFLLLWLLGRRRDARARAFASDMMAPSAMADPYQTAILAREVPNSFVRFHDADSDGDLAGMARRPASGMSRGSRGGGGGRDYDDGDAGYGNAYDELSRDSADYGSRRNTQTY